MDVVLFRSAEAVFFSFFLFFFFFFFKQKTAYEIGTGDWSSDVCSSDLPTSSAEWDGDIGRQLPLMTWDEIRDMADYGIEFGSHTRTHPALDTLEDRKSVV